MAVAVMAGCGPTKPPNAPSRSPLLATLEREMAPHEAVPWSASRRLTWDDFRGVPPAGEKERAAETAYSLFYAVSCKGHTFDFQIIAAVLPRQSWVRPSVLTDAVQNSRTLRHEQTHFDLSEVHARRMRRYFAELSSPCMKSSSELEALSDRLIRDEAAAQRRYDEETSHGRLAQRQATWDADVAKQIAALGKFVQ